LARITSTSDELAGNLGYAIENASIADCRLFRPLAENLSPHILGLLQYYLPEPDAIPNLL
jgi:hypothetical protein